MAKGKLFVVGTPIGNMDDITLRALRVLSSVEIIAAEDTRAAQHLLSHHQVRAGQPAPKTDVGTHYLAFCVSPPGEGEGEDEANARALTVCIARTPAEWLAHPPALPTGRTTGASSQIARVVRVGRYPTHRQRADSGNLAPAVAGPAADPGHSGSARLLGTDLRRSQKGIERPLPQASLAGRSVERDSHPPRPTRRKMTCFRESSR